MKIRKEARASSIQGRVVSPNLFFTSSGFTKKGQTFQGTGGTFTGPDIMTGVNVGALKGKTITSAPIYYDPRYATPDKFYFPRTEVQANAIWRHLYETDAAISVATDLFAELPWSTFDLVGISDKKILALYQDMMGCLNLELHLEGLTREFLKLGKVIPHLIFDENKGYFVRLGTFDPDYVKVTPVPFMGEEPILDLKPDPSMRAFMKSQDPRALAIKARLPAFLRDRILSNTPIPLQNTNTTYLARKTSPYRVIGVSLYTRLFRIQMFEDFLVNASIAVAQRNAAPLRVFVLGDPQTGWLPTEDDISQFAELLSIVETDPYAALIYHTGLNRVEYVGVSDKLMSISREWDFIERVKFLALGVSRSFLVGEVSFATALAGLQALLDKLQALRLKFESAWIYPKILEPVARINGFYARKKVELEHRIRLKKSDADLIVPVIKWDKTLDTTQDTTLLNIWSDLQSRGIISKRTLLAGAGINLDVERANLEEEYRYEKALADAGLLPEERSQAFSLALTSSDNNSNKTRSTDQRHRLYHVSSDILESKIWSKEGKYKGIHFTDVEPIVGVLRYGSTDDKEWQEVYSRAIDEKGALSWEDIDNELGRRGFTLEQANHVREILSAEGLADSLTYERENPKGLEETERVLGDSPKLFSGI